MFISSIIWRRLKHFIKITTYVIGLDLSFWSMNCSILGGKGRSQKHTEEQELMNMETNSRAKLHFLLCQSWLKDLIMFVSLEFGSE